MFAQLWCIYQSRLRPPMWWCGYPLAFGISKLSKLFPFVAICATVLSPQNVLQVHGQIRYKGHLSELRMEELHNIANRLERSINTEKYACDSYYDYVCSRNNPLFSVLGHLPEFSDLMQLLQALQEDPEQFEAKQKLMDFFISCCSRRDIEDCYRESFEYFKPLFGYIITKKYINSTAHDYRNFLSVLDSFLASAKRTDNFALNPVLNKLVALREKFLTPHIYFNAADLNREYDALRIYRESYKHNLRNLEQHRKRNSTYEKGVQRTMLDWTLYVFQSCNKPISYYFPTFSVHLWMTLYNTTERSHEAKHFQEIAECLKLPQYVHVLEEALVLAVVYLKSFRMAWQDFYNWSRLNQDILNEENVILKDHHLNNNRLFFTLYAQNFCEFGRELAENIFYLGLKQNQDFFTIYSCGYQTERGMDCLQNL